MNFLFLQFQFFVCYVRLAYQQNTVTYAGYGTFTNSSPFSDPIYRPTAALPQDPSFINTQFYLYSNQKLTNGTLITWTTTLNEYFETLVESVFKYKGTLDKYIGDAIMAVFGSPLPIPNHAWMAVQTAIDMRHRLQEFNIKRIEKLKPQNQKELVVVIGLADSPYGFWVSSAQKT